MIGTHFTYWLLFALMMVGLYVVITHGNLMKKLIGLSVFQGGVFLFFISLGRVEGGRPPIITEGVELYSHPLPHVLILTAIVVGVATLAVGLSLIVRIFQAYGTIEEEDVLERDTEGSGAASDTGTDDDRDAGRRTVDDEVGS
jgi:multicomponent Na+:H+ antiporter subunit C